MSDLIVQFTAVGRVEAYLTDDDDTDADLDIQPISALLTFVPSVREVVAVSMNPPRTLRLEPVQGRFEEDGLLHSIDGHLGVRLIAKCAALNLPVDYELTYDCTYTRAVYGEQKSMPVGSFTLVAPATDITVDITDPEYRRVPESSLRQPNDPTLVADLVARINAKYSLPPGGVPLLDGGTGASLTDPGADRILFWDDSIGAVGFLATSDNLTITDTTLDATGGGSGGDIDGGSPGGTGTGDIDGGTP